MVLDELLSGEATFGNKEIGANGMDLREEIRVEKEKEEGEGMINLEKNTTQIEWEESEMEMDSIEEKSGEVEEGEMVEERMLEQIESKIKKPNIKQNGKRGPKTNKAKLEIVANAVGQMKLRSRKDVILPQGQ